MGIINITPDSFSDGGRFSTPKAALARARDLLRQGVDLLDLGAESTRPGAEEISTEEEQTRLLPVVQALMAENSQLVLSIDTYKAATAEAALFKGAKIINDVWGLQHDPDMARVVAQHNAGLVIMHNQREVAPQLDILAEMEAFFTRSLQIAAQAGICPRKIVLDPGLGFGKNFEQNIFVLQNITRLRRFDLPILIGLSRKRFLGVITGREVGDRDAATLAANSFSLVKGADILRVHEGKSHLDAAKVIAALLAREVEKNTEKQPQRPTFVDVHPLHTSLSQGSPPASVADKNVREHDKISIRKIGIYAYHGVHPEETELGQRFFISLDAFLDLRPVGQGDDVNAGVSYADLAARVQELAVSTRFKTIEALAEALAADLLGAFVLLQALRIEIEKPHAPVPMLMESLSISIYRAREG